MALIRQAEAAVIAGWAHSRTVSGQLDFASGATIDRVRARGTVMVVSLATGADAEHRHRRSR